LRVNTGKISIDDFKRLFSAQKLTPLSWSETGFFIERKSPFSKTPYYHAGLFYIQEAASMLPVELMDIKPGEIILDACASPGSKTTQILSKTANQGLVIANEFRRDRVGRLLENVSRWGAGNCVITNQATSAFKNMVEFFDKI
jgi:16S rRNA C967 or C1407 C5-methylase (RsmB/RsmF family)